MGHHEGFTKPKPRGLRKSPDEWASTSSLKPLSDGLHKALKEGALWNTFMQSALPSLIGIGVQLLNNSFACNWMKCPNLYRKLMFANPHPSLAGERVDLQNIVLLILNEMSWFAQKGYVWQHPILCGVVNGQFAKEFLLGFNEMFRSIQKVMFANMGWGQFTTFFAREWMKCPDLCRKSWLPSLMRVGVG